MRTSDPADRYGRPVLGRVLERDTPEVIRRDIVTVTVARLTTNAAYRYAPPFLATIARGLDVTVAQIGIAIAITDLCGLSSPLIGRLGYGELRVRYKNELIRYYVDGGFVQVANNFVSVLTNRALLASVLERDAAENQLRTALSRTAAGSEELAIRDRLISQARGQLRVASHTG